MRCLTKIAKDYAKRDGGLAFERIATNWKDVTETPAIVRGEGECLSLQFGVTLSPLAIQYWIKSASDINIKIFYPI